MPSSNLRQVWKGMKNQLPSLKILDLSNSIYLTEVSEFSLVPNLEKLILEHCPSLVEIHESIENLKSLVYLTLKDCKTISKLPESFSKLKSLETVIISGCSNLREFPVQMSKMESLKVLEIDEVPINRMLTTTGELISWPRKSIDNFWASFPSNLVDLSLRNCGLSDDDFPMGFSNLRSLQTLDLSMNPISGLPDCIRGLGGIDLHKLQKCTSLKSLVRLPKVKVLDMWDCDSLEKVTFQSLSCIPKRIDMYLSRRSKLAEIEHWFKLEPIVKVDVKIINLLGLCNLKPMEAIKMYNASLYVSEKMHPIQGVSEYGIFNTFILGNEVPGQFSHRSSGASSMSFTMPLLPPNLGIRGFNFFSVYAKSKGLRSGLLPNHPVMIRFTNKSKSLKWIYGPSFYGIPSGDEVTVSVFTPEQHFHLKEWGIQIVEEQEDQMISTQDSSSNINSCYDPDQDVNDVIGGDLLEYQVMPGTYLLSGGPLEATREMYNKERQQQQHHGESGMTPAAEAEVEADRVCIGCKFVIMAIIRWSLALCSPSEGNDRS
ncbi:disease resistance protein RPP2B-like [Rosa chinensis]|uniref:disease resistance protein RPP2B-like n=1 Tax=Rosa chinensis TaxID=74649 RepID=UPI001AD8AADE|nr:disease resistance protein RPP2B-like [Rosa chinensis]